MNLAEVSLNENFTAINISKFRFMGAFNTKFTKFW